MHAIEQKIDAYARHRNLKVAAAELGMKFQTLYWQLRKAGVCVSGDKERWGSTKDRFGAHAERLFSDLIPNATNKNLTKFQAKYDFLVGEIKVEIKASKRQSLGVGSGGDRWAFSIKRQVSEADFFVLFAFSPTADLERIFLVPAELMVSLTTISISVNGKSKWHPYAVTPEELASIFKDISECAPDQPSKGQSAT